jgi:hypothetical protein
MKVSPIPVHHAHERLTTWLAPYSVGLLRLSLGGIFFWFGLLNLLYGST